MTTTCVELEQRRLGGRLGGEHVEGGAADAAVADGVGQRVLVDDAAAGDVDDAQAGLGLGQQVGLPIRPTVSWVFGDVEGDEVGDRPTSSSRSTSSTLIWRARSAATNGS